MICANTTLVAMMDFKINVLNRSNCEEKARTTLSSEQRKKKKPFYFIYYIIKDIILSFLFDFLF